LQLFIVTIYTALVYGLLYLTLFAYPFSFATTRHWTPQLATLPFLAILTGFLLGIILIEIFFNPWWKRRLAARVSDPMNANKNPMALVSPEDRLPPMFFASILLPMGLFWFAWTSSPTLNYWPQVLSGICIGTGITGIFVSSVSYLVDVYLLNANSALAANAFLRALFGAAFPLFSKYLYQRLGVDWATSLIGFLAAAMIPFPFLFWFKGKQIRDWSKFSFDL
jgi:DHA1 family multidrug resistance protein-like MFS transporter